MRAPALSVMSSDPVHESGEGAGSRPSGKDDDLGPQAAREFRQVPDDRVPAHFLVMGPILVVAWILVTTCFSQLDASGKYWTAGASWIWTMALWLRWNLSEIAMGSRLLLYKGAEAGDRRWQSLFQHGLDIMIFAVPVGVAVFVLSAVQENWRPGYGVGAKKILYL